MMDVQPDDRPNDLDLNAYRYRVIVESETRACKLDKLAHQVRQGIHPGTTAEVIDILSQSMRQHGALVAMELSRSRRGQSIVEDQNSILRVRKLGFWARLWNALFG